ncbi:MAG TPA: YhdP family protein [Burkholderiales bacterium]|nr:YhdP family protein [Burkholderiales bacterium]
MNQPLEKLEQLEHAIEETIDEAIPPRSRWRVAARIAGWALFALYLLFAGALLVLRYYVLPQVSQYRGDIERIASKALGQRITIGAIDADWQGLRPELLLGNVTVYDHDGRAALSLPGIEATVAWTSALIGAPRFYSLVFDRPRLEIRRDEAGRLHVAGIELHPAQGGDTGIAQWVLSQREIMVRDASVRWEDGARGAPPLEMHTLNFVLRNGFLAHRFAFKGKPPPELASALDVRGELSGGDLGDWGAWSGQVYAELEYADLAGWRHWVDYPIDIRAGKGGVRLWLELDGKRYSAATADVALSQVSVRAAKDMPLLELAYVRGRLGASQRAAKGFEVSGRRLTLRTESGIEVPPADFRVRWQMAEGAESSAGGEIEADAIELAPLAKLAEYFPFSQAVRLRLAQSDPRGSIHNLKASWAGEPDDPQHFEVRANFRRLAARAHERIPGMAGLTGRFEASEKGGSVVLGSERVSIELPGVIAEGTAQLDTLSAQVGWKLAPDRIEVSFSNLSFANGDGAGTLFGSYTRKQDGASFIDLTGNFSRADGRAVYRYVPYLPPAVVDYLKASIRTGHSNDVKLRLKGPLARFPFDDPETGTFQVVAKVADAGFRYAEGWPAAAGLTGDLVFEGKGMRILASKGEVLGVRASSVRASIPDLFHGNVRVGVEISAEDQTADFLKFIAASPVTRFLDGATEGMSAKGLGRLALQLDIPVGKPEAFKLTGEYQLVDNQINIDADAPPFSNVNGQIQFTESGISVRSLTAQLLGGPATLSVATRSDGTIAVNAQGTASAPQILGFFGENLLRHVSGAAAWQGTMTGGRGRPLTLIAQSQLVGIAADLPPPLGKEAVEPMALRVERIIPGRSNGDSIKVSLGPAIEAIFQRRREGAKYVMERGVVGVNQPAALPDREGMSVTGSLPYADADRWRALFGGKDPAGSSLSSAFDLKIAELDFAGRRLNDVALRAGTSGNVWIANVSSKELAGEIAWRAEGLGRLVARLKYFSLPDASPGKKDEPPPRDLPALDIIADKLIRNGNDLGKLELVAVNKVLDWRIENLVLTSPESTLKAEGVWQSWRLQPRFNINITGLEVSDIGRFLERLGYPRTVQDGTATLKGNLSWAGSPQSIDFATLSGELQLDAYKGQFLKAEPGAAKLMGVLSMQSWITLDFRELYGKGFAFDSVSTKARLDNGVLSTKEFHMRGPSAQVSMSGQVDLVKETQDLRARVEPSVGDSVSGIVAVVINPVWGLGALLLQKFLKNPLGQALSFEYHVTGTWDKPVPERVKADVRSASAKQEPSLP